ATWVEHHFTDDIQTRQYRCPEVILGAKCGTSADVWSLACMVCTQTMVRSILLISSTLCRYSNLYLFNPAPGPRYSKGNDQIAQIIELL
ncbi:hypothetical protein BDR03DRAFT_817577, partial [Suillus americanus]